MPVETCLQRVKLVSLTYVPVGASLRRLKLVGFIYVPVRRRGDVIVSSRTLILVIKMEQFYHTWISTFLGHLRWFSIIKVPASTLLKRLKDVALI